MSFSEPFSKVIPGDFVYGLYNTDNETMAWLVNQGCHKVMVEQGAVTKAVKLNPKYTGIFVGNHDIKRKSKMGLNLFLLKGRNVHFVLDGIDMDKVPTKSHSKDRDDGQSRSITGAELRWIYKHRNEQIVQDHVQFWFKKKPTTPPWSPDSAKYSDKWDQYQRNSQAMIDLPNITLTTIYGKRKGSFARLFCFG